MRWLIDCGDIEDLLAVATEIERRLQGDKFRDWINGTIGQIPRLNRDLPDAIDELKAPVATTNYDDYPAEVVRAGAIPWLDRPDIDQWLRGKDRRHLHLHGVWSRADTVILGHASYARLTADDRSQFIQKVIGTRRLLLIGCGAGIDDPNLGPLFGWLREELSGGNRNDYLLCLNAESHGTGPFVRVPFGDSYADLVSFIRKLAPLNARYQTLIDQANAYEFIMKTGYGDDRLWISHADNVIERLGQSIVSSASADLYDNLQDSEGGFGLRIGLVKAIAISKSYKDIHRVVAVWKQLPLERAYINAVRHTTEAFSALCPHAPDQAALSDARLIVERWLQHDHGDLPLKTALEAVLHHLPSLKT